jgi:arylsulfatase A-like enzyme
MPSFLTTLLTVALGAVGGPAGAPGEASSPPAAVTAQETAILVTGEPWGPEGELALEAEVDGPAVFLLSAEDGRRLRVRALEDASGRASVRIPAARLTTELGLTAGDSVRVALLVRPQAERSAAGSPDGLWPWAVRGELEVQLGAPRPNVLHIIIDDIGVEYLRAYHRDNGLGDGLNPFNWREVQGGNNIYPWTPTFDRLAERGVRFNQFRTNPTCSTTRAATFTGRYAFRHGIGSLVAENRVGTVGELGVGPGNQEFTLPQVLRTAGYVTGLVGKWHLALGTSETGLSGVPGQGFGHVFGFGGFDYAWSLHSNLDNWPYLPDVNLPGVSGSRDPADDVPQGYWNYASMANYGEDPPYTIVVNHQFATDKTQQRAVQQIKWFQQVHPDQPWYQVQSYHAAHSPYGDLPPLGMLYTVEYWPQISVYGLPIPFGVGITTAWTGFCAHIEALDNRLAEMFRQLGGLDTVLEDTVVLLMSDNGTPTATLTSAVQDNGKNLGPVYSTLLSGENRFKHSPYEPGVRVPLLVAGPVVTDPGRTSDALVDCVDVFSTIAEICQADVQAVVADGRSVDGRSFAPLLDGTLTDAQFVRDVRPFSLVERFSPNGDPRTISPPIDNLRQRRRAFLGRTGQGWFKIVRKLGSSGQERDEFYRLYEGLVPTRSNAIDPYELQDLYGDPTYLSDYLFLRTQFEALLATEP